MARAGNALDHASRTATLVMVRHYLATHTVEEVYRDHLSAALDYQEGNISAAARQLGVTRRTVYLAARRLGIEVGRR